MPVEFLGIAATNDGSETTARSGPIFDKEYTLRLARAHEENGWDRVLFAYGSNAPDPNIGAAYIASKTEKLQLLLAHRPNVSYPTFAAKTFATVDQVSDGRMTVHFITGGTDHEQQREGDYLTKDERYERTRECMQIVKQAWTSREPFDYDGRALQVRRLRQRRVPGAAAPAAAVVRRLVARRLRRRRSRGRHLLPVGRAAGTARPSRSSRSGERRRRRAARTRRRSRWPSARSSRRPSEQAWEKAHDTVARIEARVRASAGALSRRRPVKNPENTGSQRLIAIAERRRAVRPGAVDPDRRRDGRRGQLKRAGRHARDRRAGDPRLHRPRRRHHLDARLRPARGRDRRGPAGHPARPRGGSEARRRPGALSTRPKCHL